MGTFFSAHRHNRQLINIELGISITVDARSITVERAWGAFVAFHALATLHPSDSQCLPYTHYLCPLSLPHLHPTSIPTRMPKKKDAELDSLDSHLADFRSAPNVQLRTPDQRNTQPSMQTTTTITTVNLPTHDGLGTFQLGDTVGMSAALQERLYAFEQFNPRRVTKRRRESPEPVPPQVEQEISEEMQRIQRIEEWRLDHSRVLLEEIRKQTRRRRGSELSSRRGRVEEAATAPASAASIASASDAVLGEADGEWHDQEDDDLILGMSEDGDEHGEGLWSRITRKFMVEVMGIDDEVLSILLGETLPKTVQQEESIDPSPTPRASDAVLAAFDAVSKEEAEGDDTSSSWRLRMLDRIAKELGHFVHRHMTTHPGAFTTYQRVQQMPLPYAGLPVIPEAMTPPDRERPHDYGRKVGKESQRGDPDEVDQGTTPHATAATAATTPSLPHFQPTILQARPTVPEGQHSSGSVATSGPSAAATPSQAASSQTFSQEEWEQDLDIKLVFRYLRSRFTSDAPPPTNSLQHHLHHHPLALNNNISMQDAAAKVARVRLHHPLVGRNTNRQAGDRRPMPAYRNMNMGVVVPTSPITGLRHQPSCASQSTRRSARRSSSLSSSRHYWDIGGSIGTGSMIAPAAPMGSWGEA
ncbi:hypothetical protein CMQ_3242 [Grosmannia clavigera kw1407]|uniref:Uncharacterized protein n=1 Tax=Grosmannia clavigera (strain kw1407 / UAMH 11150) TaxID=655863 RepID=F0XH94_GROCL|nr:uncharacterized protein CMQ_3242 [Grosmannia clavigera kw1407]EFX03313.1 hypothetical protein CMQ_3242 [Grosmannia clavigera kw1407]